MSPGPPRETTAPATAKTTETVDPDSRNMKTSNPKQPANGPPREGAYRLGRAAASPLEAAPLRAPRSPGPRPGRPTPRRGRTGRRGLVSPRQPRRARGRDGKERWRNGVRQPCTLTLLLGSWDCEKRGGNDSRPLPLRRGLHLSLPVSHPATAILKPRAPPPSLRHFLFLRIQDHSVSRPWDHREEPRLPGPESLPLHIIPYWLILC